MRTTKAFRDETRRLLNMSIHPETPDDSNLIRDLIHDVDLLEMQACAAFVRVSVLEAALRRLLYAYEDTCQDSTQEILAEMSEARDFASEVLRNHLDMGETVTGAQVARTLGESKDEVVE